MGKVKYVELRKNKEILRWFEDVSRGSRVTADVYIRRLGSFCEDVGRNPEQLIKLRDRILVDLITDYVSGKEKEGKAGSYVKSTLKAVKSWLTFNGITLSRKVKIRNAEDTPSLKDEKVPTQEELKKILISGDSRSRLACALMAFSGLRPGVFGNFMGTDGLTISDIPELKIERGKISFERVPLIIMIRKELSKTNRNYFTFLGPEGTLYLEAYLNERIEEGEEIGPYSPIITPSKFAIRSAKPFIRTINIGDIIRQSIRSAGFNLRPYVLRAYFDTRLMMAQDDRLLIRDYRTFWMGHKGDIEHTYTTNKGRLSEDTIEKMREGYRRSIKFLETEHKGISENEMNEKINEFKRMMLILAGYSNEEIDSGKFLELNNEELAKKIDEKKAKSINNGNPQKVISIKEVKQYIEQGWEFVKDLNSKEAIIRIPR